jgi:creatinine amidohydrolase/Fe(II)-dependent formamide hydrolase-like protein
VFTADANARSVKARPKDATNEKGREIVPALISRNLKR